MVKLRAFIFDTVMHLYWGYLQERNYASIDNILKVMNFFKNSHFALFCSFDIHAKYIWHTADLHMHRYSDICTETLTHRYRYTETHASL